MARIPARDENGHGTHPVPAHLAREFKETMESISTLHGDGPNWMEVLEEAADAFMRRRGIKGDKNEATHQYFDLAGA